MYYIFVKIDIKQFEIYRIYFVIKDITFIIHKILNHSLFGEIKKNKKHDK